MRVPAVALGINQSVATAVVYGSGAFGCAAAGLLAVAGRSVMFIGQSHFDSLPSECDLLTEGRARFTGSIQIEQVGDLAGMRSNDVVVVAVPATEYGTVAEDLAPVLSSGQTVFILGAAFGASLEIANVLDRRRTDLSINLVEIVQPFSRYQLDGKTVVISGLLDRMMISGRSLNETRAGLAVGATLMNGLVPASNIIDRAFADSDRWLETAAWLFNAFDRSPLVAEANDTARLDFSPVDNTNQVLLSLRAEIEALGKAYGVKRIAESRIIDSRLFRSVDWHQIVAQRVIDEFAILSSLARLTHMPVPLIDMVIDLAGMLTGTDLRREARQLTDLGIIGMDAQEIIEHVN